MNQKEWLTKGQLHELSLSCKDPIYTFHTAYNISRDDDRHLLLLDSSFKE